MIALAESRYTPPQSIEFARLKRALADRFEIMRLLGCGATACVYLARERGLQRLVAVKVLGPASAASALGRERFRREATTAARLAHPSIVPIHAFAEEMDGLAYLVMGYVQGESLAERLKRDGRVPVEEACRILGDLADALDYAHRRGVIHRDVKPENILLDAESGRAMLTDFGVAGALTTDRRLPADAAGIGTPHFMSPEQAFGDHNVDWRSDLYALGVVGYLMLAGRLPFEGSNVRELMAQHAVGEAVPLRAIVPGLPDMVAATIMRCLAKDPAARWPDGRCIRDALGVEGLRDGRLPERLRAAESSLLHLGVGGAALVPYAFLVNAVLPSPVPAPRILAGALGLLCAATIAGFAVLRLALQCHRLGARELLGIAYRQPRWWLAWYPRGLRDPQVMWERLPAAVQAFRSVLFTALVVGALVTPTLLVSLLLGVGGAARNGAYSLLVAAGVAAGAYAAALAWGRRRHLRPLEVNDLCLRNLSKGHVLWRYPRIARLLVERT